MDGAGVGVAIIDSGAMASHDDLAGTNRVINSSTSSTAKAPHATTTVTARTSPVSSPAINSRSPNRHRPGRRLVVLKCSMRRVGADQRHRRHQLRDRESRRAGIRVIVFRSPPESASHATPTLTLAARSAMQASIVVVASAGNFGRGADGRGQSTVRLATRRGCSPSAPRPHGHDGSSDDGRRVQLSRALGGRARRTRFAPGVGIESLSAPDSALYSSMSAYLLSGTVSTSFLPYLSLSGTSMSAPVVSGTVALMLQANPALTPNAVKAILQYTSQTYAPWDPLTQGTGFLSARGAVELARAFADPSTSTPSASSWTRRILWGNQM